MMKPFHNLWRSLRRRGLQLQRHRAKASRDSQNAFSLDWLKIGLVFLTIAALSVMMSVHLLPDKISLRRGDLSPREVRAARSVIYVNNVATDQLRRATALGVRPVYDSDEAAVTNANRIVKEFFDRIENERALLAGLQGRRHLARKAAETLAPQFGGNYTTSQLMHLLTLSPALLQKLRSTTTRLVADAMDREIRDQSDDLSHTLQDISRAAATMLSPEDAAIAHRVAQQAVRPTRLLNRRKTEEAREREASKVAPVYEQISRGDRIITAGEKVTDEHIDKFTALGLLNPHLELTTSAAVCVLAAAMVFLVILTIAKTLPALYADRKRLALLTVIVLLSFFGLKVGSTMLGLQFSSGQLGYLGMMSVAAAGMLVSVLLDRNLAVLIVALLSVQSGLLMNHEIRFTVMTLMSGLVAILSVGSVRSKSNLLTTTAVLAAANLGLVWLLGLLLRDSLPELLTGSAWAIGAAALAVFLYWFGVLMMEKPFGILTHTTLLEMSAFDRPLLTQLCAVAPGTYAHSIMVGTLAEAGAQAIGADALLCRVGGYYHDIGKSKRPDFFVENQRRENVHCRLSPSLSALIITAHVRDGVEMAKQFRLPEEIRDIIAQHHGTTLIRYFYHQALTDCGGSEEAPPGLEERFRYPGPKPQTREAAIVMLADSLEAAARCLDKPSMERIETLIASILRDKIEDGQLDECQLTFKDLKSISDAFLHVLTAMMHGRIDYPQMPAKTGTGRPMEVVQPDLRPEPVVTFQPTELTPDSLYFPTGTGLENEISREIEAHRGTYPLAEGGAGIPAETLEDALLSNSSALAAQRAAPEASEVLYDRLSAERPSAPDQNDAAAPGRATPVNRRRRGKGGSQYPADR